MVKEKRTLRADEIEVRPAHKVKDKISMLLYIDSRAVTKFLDDWVTPLNWQTKFKQEGNMLIGYLGIYDEEKKEWIWKADCGTESNIEAEKGLISDTYKRLLSRWGVTELYSAPDILVADDNYGNKGYKVKEIKYNDNREITHLVIVNRWGKEVFRTGDNNIPLNTDEPKKTNFEILKEYCSLKKMEEGINKVELTSFFNFYKDKVNEWQSFNPKVQFDKWMKKTNVA